MSARVIHIVPRHPGGVAPGASDVRAWLANCSDDDRANQRSPSGLPLSCCRVKTVGMSSSDTTRAPVSKAATSSGVGSLMQAKLHLRPSHKHFSGLVSSVCAVVCVRCPCCQE